MVYYIMPARGRSRTPRSSRQPGIYVRTRNSYSSSATPRRERALQAIRGNKIIKQYVKKQLDKAIENKTINEKEYDHSVIEKQLLGGTGHFYYSLSSLYNMTQGTGEFQRIGNSITNKKTILRFLIHPQIMQAPYNDSSIIFNQFTYQGYFTMALIKMRDGSTPPSGLTSFLQNGNSAITPSGKVYDLLYSPNTDLYKVYWKKTYKLGPSAPAYQNPHNGDSIPAYMHFNNDFKLTASDTIRVDDYIGKNGKITFNDNTVNAVLPSCMSGLALIGYWTPSITDVLYDNGRTSFYKVHLTAVFEYEDA